MKRESDSGIVAYFIYQKTMEENDEEEENYLNMDLEDENHDPLNEENFNFPKYVGDELWKEQMPVREDQEADTRV